MATTKVSEAAVKVATPDLLLIQNEPVSGSTMSALLFQKISNVEIITFSRPDLINGANYRLQKISNINDIRLQYNTNTIIPMPDSSNLYFEDYGIDFNFHVPSRTSGVNNEVVYINENGDLVIELSNLDPNFLVEIESLNDSLSFEFINDTIYGEQ
jgi:hypothetical protein